MEQASLMLAGATAARQGVAGLRVFTVDWKDDRHDRPGVAETKPMWVQGRSQRQVFPPSRWLADA